jgi:hypothetical protein
MEFWLEWRRQDSFYHLRMSPIVDQESTFDDTEKGGNTHNLCWRPLVFVNFLGFRFTKFHTFFAAKVPIGMIIRPSSFN